MTSTFPKNSVFFAAAAMALAPAAALVFLAPGAYAQTAARTSATIEVYVGDIETGRDGAGQVSKRLETAARSVCAAIATRSPLAPREQADCVRTSVAEAMNRIADQRAATILASVD